MCMTTKTITIMEDAYKALKREKKNEESFSKVILRLTDRKGSVSELFGSWEMSDDEAERIKGEIKKLRSNWEYNDNG